MPLAEGGTPEAPALVHCRAVRRDFPVGRRRTPAPLPVSEESLMPKTTLRFLSGAFMMLLLVTPLWAQSTATLQGTVTDAQGGLVPGASVTATNEATGVQRAVITDSSGHYQMASLPGGSYRLDARLTGFQPKVVHGVVLGAEQTVGRN